MKKLIIGACAIAAITAVLLGGVFAYMVLFFARPSITNRVLTQEEIAARELPVGSSNVFNATSGVGLGGRARLLRLQAPLINILSYVERKLDADDAALPPVAPLSVDAPMLEPYGLEGVAWFDVENISTGFEASGPEYNSMIYVDSDRELYYYIRTD